MNRCIHKYVRYCKTNPKPPGFADFLRGTITLIKYSIIHNYDFYIDKESHKLFELFKENKYVIAFPEDSIIEFFELLPPDDYLNIDNKIHKLFKSKKNFSLITSGFYNCPHNWGTIPSECKQILKQILIPNDILCKKINDIKKEIYMLDISKQYKVIHIRTGDRFIHTNQFSERVYDKITRSVSEIIKLYDEEQLVIISDCDIFARKLIQDFPILKCWINKKIHLGDLCNDEQGIEDTIIDFFIMSGSNEIIPLFNSGFSTVVSLLFDIPYTTKYCRTQDFNDLHHTFQT